MTLLIGLRTILPRIALSVLISLSKISFAIRMVQAHDRARAGGLYAAGFPALRQTAHEAAGWVIRLLAIRRT